jgi:ribonuclease HII
LVAGAVLLRKPIPGLKDSKKLSKLQREKFAKQIHAEALAVGLGWVEPNEIDTVGIVRSVGMAMERALSQITMHFEELVIDGNYNFFEFDPRAKAIVKADDSVPCVSAASIIAKVARDQYMAAIAAEYPGYGFERHVGYGTALHIANLQKLGVSAIHRRSYKPILALLEGQA